MARSPVRGLLIASLLVLLAPARAASGSPSVTPGPAPALPDLRLWAYPPVGLALEIGQGVHLGPTGGPLRPGPGSVFALREVRVRHALVLIWPVPSLEELQEPSRAILRQRERARLFGVAPAGLGVTTGVGVALFGAAALFAAHAPAPLRFLIDRSVHPGPALLAGSALGTGSTGIF